MWQTLDLMHCIWGAMTTAAEKTRPRSQGRGACVRERGMNDPLTWPALPAPLLLHRLQPSFPIHVFPLQPMSEDPKQQLTRRNTGSLEAQPPNPNTRTVRIEPEFVETEVLNPALPRANTSGTTGSHSTGGLGIRRRTTELFQPVKSAFLTCHLHLCV